MLPFGVTIPATVPQRSEIPEGLMNYPVLRLRLINPRNVDDWISFYLQMKKILIEITYSGQLNRDQFFQKKRRCNEPQAHTTLPPSPLSTFHPFPSCSKVLLEKLIGSRLVKKYPAFYGTRRFITALKRVRQLSLSWASTWIQRYFQSPTRCRFRSLRHRRVSQNASHVYWNTPTSEPSEAGRKICVCGSSSRILEEYFWEVMCL